MPQNDISIGQKLRRFRETRGLTQQQIELDANLSSGHISKIESGKVNPTKELLFNISDILKLNSKEKQLLLGLNTHPVTQEEIDEATKYVQDYFQSTENPAYLADDFWFTWTANRKMFELIGAPLDDIRYINDFINKNKGTHILEWLFNDFLGVKQRISGNLWREICVNQAIFFINLIDYFNRIDQIWLKKLLEKLYRFDDFESIWEESKKKAKENLCRNELIVTFEVKNDCYNFFIANSHLNKYPRFMAVEYIPCDISKNGINKTP